ncbi:formate/nitrite transporter family protein [Massilibacteroides vaginae]|uniref:formate/nitrite transporter family protein n=1 Tax=Massilibacteroides vaginae TaxID=1673718 RepID=UPI000A1C915E|nr:formate/nitrite transporter family protein [Massilibacteroides vaginae]
MENYNSPRKTTLLFSDAGLQKTKYPLSTFVFLSIQGGAFIALGSLLSVVVAGGMSTDSIGLIKFAAGALFPVGLIMIIFTGSDLFTSNCATLTIPLLRKQIRVGTFLKYLFLSYVLNFVGTQFIAFLLSNHVGLLDKDPWQSYLFHLAENKVNQDFLTVVIKGIGANWLVCLGVWLGCASNDVIGKYIGIWTPIMIFVTLGYEHSIANMFFIPAAIYSGADISWTTFILQNLIPSTIGNLIGGGVLIGCLYWFIHIKRTQAEMSANKGD